MQPKIQDWVRLKAGAREGKLGYKPRVSIDSLSLSRLKTKSYNLGIFAPKADNIIYMCGGLPKGGALRHVGTKYPCRPHMCPKGWYH